MRFFPAKLIPPALLVCAFAGCRSDEGILQETIRHEDREELRLRVAILEHDDYVLFIRVDGPVALVTQHQKVFDTFVKSTRFPDKKEDTIQWTEPAGWKKDPPIKGRDATYRIDAKPKELEVKISRLHSKGYHLLPNMHRWQKQIDMPLSDDMADAKKFYKEDELGKRKLTWVDLKGLGVHTVSKPRDPKDQHKDFLGGLNEDQEDQPFKYTVPPEWKKAPPGKLPGVEAYEVTSGAKSARITVMPISGAKVADNVNRWRDNVGLKPFQSPKEVTDSVRLIQVGGIKSTYADIANDKGPPEKNRILGVIVPINRRSAWSIAMTGPIDLVEQNKNTFESFVESFKK